MTHQESEERRFDNHEERRESRLDRQQSGGDSKSSLNGVVLVVISVVLSATVGLLGWTANAVVDLGKEQTKTAEQGRANTKSIEDIQVRGSPVIQSVLARLDGLQAGQVRMEALLTKHLETG